MATTSSADVIRRYQEKASAEKTSGTQTSADIIKQAQKGADAARNVELATRKAPEPESVSSGFSTVSGWESLSPDQAREVQAQGKQDAADALAGAARDNAVTLANTPEPEKKSGFMKFAGKVTDAIDYVNQSILGGAASATKGLVDSLGYTLQLGAQQSLVDSATTMGLARTLTGDEAYTRLSQELYGEAETMRNAGLNNLSEYGNLEKASEKLKAYEAQTAELGESLPGAVRLVGNVAGGIGGMVPVIASELIAPGSGLYVLFSQAMGGAVSDALAEGAEDSDALTYGVAVGMVEVLTEKMFDGMSGIFGKGAADDAVKTLAKKLVKSNPAAQTALVYLANTLGEGVEEYVSEWADWFINQQVIGTDDRNAKAVSGDAAYSMLVGSLISAVLGSYSAVKNGQAVTAERLAEQTAEMFKASIEQSETAETAEPAETAKQNSAKQVAQILSEPVTNSKAETILSSDALKAAFTEATGRELSGTKSQQRAIIKEAAATLSLNAQTVSSVQDGVGIPPAENNADTNALNSPHAQTTAPEADVAADAKEIIRESQQKALAAQKQMNVLTRDAARQQSNTIVDVTRPEPVSVGAADSGFSPFTQWQNETPEGRFQPVNAQAEARTAAERERAASEVPLKNPSGRLTSKHASTLINTPVTTNEMAAAIEKELANGTFSRVAYSDDAAAAKSTAHIEKIGWEAAYAEYRAAVRNGKSSKDITVLGQALYNNAVNSGDVMSAMDIAALMIEHAKNTAQALQAMNMINKATPEARLYLVMESIENLKERIEKKYGGKAPDISIDKAALQAYYDALKSGDKSAQTEAWHVVAQNIADQIPPSWKDKLNSWRYLAMLGNPRTHIRNIVGNAGFAPVRFVKNMFGTGIEASANAVSKAVGKGGIDRTKAILNPASAADRALFQLGWKDFDGVVDVVQSGGKYENTAENEIDNLRTVFRFKPVEALRKFNNAALDAEDTWFSRPAYASSLAQYLKANGISANDVSSGTVSAETAAAGRAYAVKEAQKATYRDANALSDFVSRLGKNYTGENNVGKAVNVLVEGVLPFKRTPANIVMRGVEYSPVGLGKGLYDALFKVRKGEVSAAQAIDEIASGLTGTGLAALGFWLAGMGVATGSGSDDEKQGAFDKLRGGQTYALSIGDKSYTIDWLAPEALPFFVGVEVYNYLADQNGYTPVEGWAAIRNLSDPILETSMLSSLEDMLESVKYADGDYIGTIASNATINYLSQYLPTIGGQVERSFLESDREETYRYGDTENLSSSGAYLLGQAANKIPGIDYSQIPYVDAWGRPQDQGNVLTRTLGNFLNPAYISEDRSTAVDDELQRLYDAGFTAVLPSKPPQSTKLNGEYLTADEYVTYTKTKGQTALALVSALMDSGLYGSVTDEAKAEAISDIYEYATDRAKKAVLDGRSEAYESSWDDEAKLSDLPELLAVKNAFNRATPDGGEYDYAAIDALADVYDGLSAEAKKLLDNSAPRLDQIVAANAVGIDAETWYGAYSVWKEINGKKAEGYSATDKATDFAVWVDKTKLDDKQKTLLKEQLTFSTGYSVEAGKYDALTRAGLPAETAEAIYDEVSALASTSGTVTAKQKYAAISEMNGLTEAQKLAAMSAYDTSGDSTYEKYAAAQEAGISTSDVTDFLAGIDANKNGGVSSGELAERVGSSGFTDAQNDAVAVLFLSDSAYTKYTAAREAGYKPGDVLEFYSHKNDGTKAETKAWALASGYTVAEFNELWKLFS